MVKSVMVTLLLGHIGMLNAGCLYIKGLASMTGLEGGVSNFVDNNA